MSKKKKPCNLVEVNKKRPISKENVESFYNKYPSWRFGRSFNQKKSKWSFHPLEISEEDWKHLRDFETMTWHDILKASGGRKHGNNSHYVTIDKLTDEAKKEAEREQIFEGIFSLRLTGTHRFIGFLSDGVLSIIWYDKDHSFTKTDKNQ